MIHHGDCLEVMQEMNDNTVDSLVTDPPAGIAFMGKAWDTDRGGRDDWIEWMTTIMQEAKRVMKPGAHGLVWAIPRTSHWTATALENAGFEIRDVVTHLFGTGFPKSQNIGKAIDKAAGVERVLGKPKTYGDGHVQPTSGSSLGLLNDDGWKPSMDGFRESDPATPQAKQWDGWGTALKPASEHWILIRKPISEKTIAKNVIKWGTGGINIDGCRIGAGGDHGGGSKMSSSGGTLGKHGHYEADGFKVSVQGRFPANLVLSGDAPSMLDEQSGDRRSSGNYVQAKIPNSAIFGEAESINNAMYADSGGASRFFYCAKASKADRGEGNKHPTVKSTKLMQYLIRLITPPSGLVLDPFMGSGSTGKAALAEGFEFIGIEQEQEYYEIAKERLNYGRTQG